MCQRLALFTSLILAFLLQVLPCEDSFAQTSQIDSLDYYEDGKKIEVLLTEAKKIRWENIETADSLFRLAISISKEAGLDKEEAKAYTDYAWNLRTTNQFDSAAHYYKLAEGIATTIKDTSELGYIYLGKGVLAFHKSDQPGSLQNYHQSLEYFEQVNDETGIAKVSNNIGRIYANDISKEFEKALFYYRKSQRYFNKIKDPKECWILLNMAFAFRGLEQYDSTLYYSNRSLEIATENEMHEDILLAHHMLSVAYNRLEEFDISLAHAQKALLVAEEYNFSGRLLMIYQNLANTYLKLKQPEETIKIAEKALQSFEDNSIKHQKHWVYQELSHAYEQLNDFQNALKYNRLFHAERDSALNNEKISQINAIEAKYESEKKESEIALLSLENKLAEEELSRKRYFQTGLITIIVLLIGFFVFYLYSLRSKHRLKEQLLESELQELRAKITAMLENQPDALNLSFETLNNSLNQPLSEREYDVLSLILKGMGNQEIADQLFLSINTVKFHLKNIYEKLGVSNRKEALKFVISSS